jgi:nucleoside-diphosphate-sugar epimerase
MTDYYDPLIKQSHIRTLREWSRFEFVEADLNSVALEPLLRDVEFIFHQAGQPGVRKSWGREFGLYLDQNVSATQRLLEAATGAGSLRKFVYASSSSIYGNAERYPTMEDDRPEPMSPYGVSKLAGEQLAVLYARNYGLPTVALRYFTVYGPRQRPDMAFHRFVKAALLREPITVFGTGEQIRDFTHVTDVVEANYSAAISTTLPGAIYNVAGGSNTSVNEVLRMLDEMVGYAIERNWAPPVAGDVFQTGGATSKIAQDLGWRPEISLADGLLSEFQWLQEKVMQSDDQAVA